MADSSKLHTVRKLVDTAESLEQQGNHEAAATYRERAEAIMLKYRIEEEDLIARDQVALLPGTFRIELARRGPYTNSYTHMFSYIARHTGIRVHFIWDYDTDGNAIAVARGAGYQTDVEYAEMLFTSARLVFQDKLEPRVKADLSVQENAYRLRASGMERVRIASLLGITPNQVGRYYKAECTQRGEEAMLSGRGVTGAAYREQYAEQFVYTLGNRLRMAQDAAGKAGGGLVLHGRAERVQEAYYAAYPEYKPRAALPTENAPAKRQACDKCAKSKRGACTEHYIPMGRSTRGRDYNSVAAERGRAAGAAAARSVGLRSTGTGSIGGA